MSSPAAAHNNRGVAYLGAGNWRAAHGEFLQALTISPDYLAARLNLSGAESHLLPPAAPEFRNGAGPSAGAHPDSRGRALPGSAPSRSDESQRSAVSFAVSGHAGCEDCGKIERWPPGGPHIPEAGSQLRKIGASWLYSDYAVQFYTSKNEENARAVGEALAKEAGIPAVIERADSPGAGNWYRVRLAGFGSFGTALRAAERLARAGLVKDYWIVPPGD